MVDAVHRRKDNLPVDRSQLVGRHQELVDLKQSLSASRLVTLTGVGGVGKTRLALAAASQIRRGLQPDGVWLIELASLFDPDLVPLTVMQALGIEGREHEDASSALIDYLRGRKVLLVLDNCEHLIDPCATLVDRVLKACAHVQVLATSREPLNIDGECVYVVPPLAVPETGRCLAPGDGLLYGALLLFAERAAAAVPGFTITSDNHDAVAALCRHLDGLPLPIELAAVRLRSLSLEELLARQTDRYQLLTQGSRAALPRHKTLRAAVDWSFDLCTEHEQLLWARASVFAGSFDLEAAERVCADERLESSMMVDALTGLLEKSILSRDRRSRRTRYRFLETMRSYGQEQLARRTADPALKVRHRDHYLAEAQHIDTHWFGPDQHLHAERLRDDQANLRAALDHCLSEPDDSHCGFRMVLALTPYWMACGQQREARHWLDRLMLHDKVDSSERTGGLWLSAFMAALGGDGLTSMALLDEYRIASDGHRNDRAHAHAAFVHGLAGFTIDDQSAVAALDEAVRLERMVDQPNAFLPLALTDLGLCLCCVDQVERAVTVLEEARAISDAHGDRWVRAVAVITQGLAEWLRGDLDRARSILRDGLREKHELGDLLGMAVAVEFLALTAEAADPPERAARLLGASRAMWEPLGAFAIRVTSILTWHNEAEQRLGRILGDQAFHDAQESGRVLDRAEIVALALGASKRSNPASPMPAPALSLLSRREVEIAELISDGLTNREIAVKLVLAVRTVETHVAHIFTKLGFHSRTQLALWFAQARVSARDK